MALRFVLGGGIASGKSSAATCFEGLGVLIIRADEVARGVLEPDTPEFGAVAAAWPDVVAAGRIDRAALGRTVFADPEALAHLEDITHPETRRRIRQVVEANAERASCVEIPILRDWFEGWPLVVVDAPEEFRLDRASERGGLTRGEVRAIMARQAPRSEWLMAADYVIDNSGSIEDLEEQCRRVWERLSEGSAS